MGQTGTDKATRVGALRVRVEEAAALSGCALRERDFQQLDNVNTELLQLADELLEIAEDD